MTRQTEYRGPHRKLRRLSARTRDMINRTIAACAAEYGLTPAELMIPTRRREIVEPRQLAIYILRKWDFLSLCDICFAFDKDHTTIIYSCRAVQNLIDTDTTFQQRVARVAANPEYVSLRQRIDASVQVEAIADRLMNLPKYIRDEVERDVQARYTLYQLNKKAC